MLKIRRLEVVGRLIIYGQREKDKFALFFFIMTSVFVKGILKNTNRTNGIKINYSKKLIIGRLRY